MRKINRLECVFPFLNVKVQPASILRKLLKSSTLSTNNMSPFSESNYFAVIFLQQTKALKLMHLKPFYGGSS